MPTACGQVAAGFEEVRYEFERNFAERGEIGAAVAAYWRGEKIVDLWGGRRMPEGDAPCQGPTLVGEEGCVGDDDGDARPGPDRSREERGHGIVVCKVRSQRDAGGNLPLRKAIAAETIVTTPSARAVAGTGRLTSRKLPISTPNGSRSRIVGSLGAV